MGKYVDFYCKDNNRELKKVVNKYVGNAFPWIPQSDYDDLYSIAAKVVWDCEKSFDESLGKTFENFVVPCIKNKIMTEYVTHGNREKRQAYQKDSDGKLKKDEDGKPIPIQDVSIYSPIGDDENATVGDFLRSKFDIWDELEGENGEFGDEKVEKYLSSLSKVQRQIVEMKMEEIPVGTIKEKLGLTEKQYEDQMKSIRQNRNITLFNKNNNREQYRKVEDRKMNINYEENMEDMMDIDTTDSYRTDKIPLGSLLDDKSCGLIDSNYISQRQPFQWGEEQINKFYSRILNNQPIPEIVICEKVDDKSGEKISFLIDGLQRLTYAEEFKEGRIKIKAKGAEFVNVKYKKPVVGEDGKTRYVIDVCNIIGKTYKDLPKFLQKRFDNFNVTVTRFFNCTSEMIDYHMRNYNNHVAMNKVQYGITNVSNNTAFNIKNISENHEFFKDIISCNSKDRKKGTFDEVVGRTIMATYFMDDWKREPVDVFRYIEKHATDKHFEELKTNLSKLAEMFSDVDKSVTKYFNTTNACVWLAAFKKFTELNLGNEKFVEFMKDFPTKLHNKEINGRTFSDVCKRNTKDKTVVVAKLEVILDLMYDYLKTEPVEQVEIDVLRFVQECVSENCIDDDVELYKVLLKDYEVEVDSKSTLLEEENKPSLIAIVGYACKEEKDGMIPEWFVKFFKENNTYLKDQKENYLHMKGDFDSFVMKREKEVA